MKMKRFLSVLLALTMVCSMELVSARAADVTMQTLFPDEVFRTAVIEQIDAAEADQFYSGTKPAPLSVLSGTALTDALADYVGDIVYHGKEPNGTDLDKKIYDVHGIQYLLRANSVDIKYNEITDFSWLESTDSFYYGITGDDYLNKYPERTESTNVYWILGGNPFARLPNNFGGRLVIDDPARQSYTYPMEDENRFIFARSEAGMKFSGTVNIQRCTVGPQMTPVKFVSCAGNRHGSPNPYVPEVKQVSPDTAQFSGISLSTYSHVAIGADEELHCMTTDEYGDNATAESVSFKYYIPYDVYVYDSVTIGFQDGVTLTKADQNGDPVAEAEYVLYKLADDGSIESTIGTYATNEKGIIEVTKGLSLGTFALKETKAPSGYELDDKPIEFEIINALPQITIDGGVTSFTTSDNKTVNVRPGELRVFIAGPEKNTYSPDIQLGSTGDISKITSVKVIYSSLISGFDADGVITGQGEVTHEFTSLTEAQSDINAEKNASHIAGPVRVNVAVEGANTIKLEHENKKVPPPSPSAPTVTVKGEKIWEDDNNSGKTRPTSVKVELYRDGESYRTAAATASNDWKYSFSGLTKYRTGNTLYTYTIQEADVPEGYISAVDSVTSSTGNTVTTTITNTLTPPEKPPVTPEEPREPGDPADPQNPNESPTPPLTTPPGDPNEPGTPPTTPPAAPPTASPSNGILPQTGTTAASSAVALCLLALAALCAVCVALFLRKSKETES